MNRNRSLRLGLRLTILLIAPAVQASSFGPNLRVNHGGDGSFQSQPQIASGPAGQLYVAWHDWRHTSGSIYFSRSLDGGASFDLEQRVDADGPLLVEWPQLAVDGLGTIYVAWVSWEPGETGRVYCARSLDGGLTFEEPVPVSDSPQGDRAWPAICGDPFGGVYVVWCDFRNGEYVVDLYAAYSPDGSSFSPNVKANQLPVGPTCTPPLPDIAAGPEPGQVHLVWRQTGSLWARWIYACRSTDWATSFTFPVEVSHEPWLYDG